jgi:hypothetical protein
VVRDICASTGAAVSTFNKNKISTAAAAAAKM